MRFGLCFSYVEMLTNEINEFGFVWPLKRSPIYRSCAGWTIWYLVEVICVYHWSLNYIKDSELPDSLESL